MKTNRRILHWLALLVFLALNPQLSTSFAQGTSFTYQGRLNDRGNPATGFYDFRFTLYDSATNGNAVSGFLTNSTTPVSSGLFSVMLDFGSGVFTGPERWLLVEVRTNGGGVFTALSPPQQVMSTPYAAMANTASNLLGALPAGQLSGTVPLAQLPAAVVTNGAAGLTLAGNFGGSFSGSGAGLTGINGNSIQSGTIGSAQLASGIGEVPPGTIVLSATGTNAALTEAGFAPVPAGLGTSWTLATNPAPWAPRNDFGTVAFNGQMWVLGGRPTDTFPFATNDVWSSSNGVAWTCVTNAAPWSPRKDFGTVTFNGQIWVLGGSGPGGLNDVWSSSNGVAWTCVTNAAPWSRRSAFGALAFNDRIWVLGGTQDYPANSTNDVWSSSDGVAWTQATAAAPWSPRQYFGAVALNGQMWVLGGQMAIAGALGLNAEPVNLNDVWSSSDGVIWTQVTGAAPWSVRYGPGALAMDGQIWVLGGGWWYGRLADVWFSHNATANTLGGFYLFQKQ